MKIICCNRCRDEIDEKGDELRIVGAEIICSECAETERINNELDLAYREQLQSGFTHLLWYSYPSNGRIRDTIRGDGGSWRS